MLRMKALSSRQARLVTQAAIIGDSLYIVGGARLTSF